MSTLPPLLARGRAGVWALWFAPAAALALVLGWETDWGRALVRVPPPAPPLEPKPVAAVVLPEYQIEGGLPGHAETVGRTLFNATRRPAPVLAADSGPRQIVRGRYQLMGTTVAGDKHIAFLKEASGKTHVVRQGEELSGMKVALVGPDRVTFTAGDDSEELILKVAPGPKTTLVAAPPPPGPAPAAGRATAAAPAPARAAQPAANVAAQPQPPQNAKAARRAARGAAGAQGGQATDGADQSMQRRRAK
jgi:hypothetical protein